MSKHGLVRDLTNVETVYTARLKTVSIKLRDPFHHGAVHESVAIADLTDVEQVLDSIFATLMDDQEHYVLLILNLANELIGFKIVASGPSHACNLDPKIMFRSALLLGGSRIILAHNHPSGCTRPEPLDVLLTGTLAVGGRVLDIDILDHFIYTPKEQLSMREHLPRLFLEQQAQPDA